MVCAPLKDTVKHSITMLPVPTYHSLKQRYRCRGSCWHKTLFPSLILLAPYKRF
jgi:hypothetical protein